MRVIFLMLFLFAQAFFLQSQEVVFEEEQLNRILQEELNRFRNDNSLRGLTESEILNAVAFDQAEYIIEKNRVVHDQEKQNKKRLLDRILYYEGLYAEAGENAALIDIGSKSEIKKGGDKVIINTQERAVKAVITAWLGEEDSRLNLLDSDFEHFGSAVIIEEKRIVTVVVMASLPYQNQSKGKLPLDFHGIDPYNQESCREFLDEYSTLPQLFSDALKVQNGKVYFEFHSLDFFKKVFSDGGDGIAVDIVCNDQFQCNESNRLFPGSINKGYLLAPQKKAKLMISNQWIERNAVRVELGDLPDFFSVENCELNGVIIKGGVKCEGIPYNRIETNNLRQIKIPLLLAGDTLHQSFSWVDTLNYEILLNQKKDSIEERLVSISDEMELLNFNIESSYIDHLVSPADQNSRAESYESEISKTFSTYADDSLLFKIDDKVAWEAYNKFQENTFYQLETQEMDTAEKVAYLKETRVIDQKLNEFLNGQNMIRFTFIGKARIYETDALKKKLSLLKLLQSQLKIEPALVIQRHLIEKILVNEFDVKELPKNDPSQKQFTLPLISNQIVITQILGEDKFQGNSLHKAFLELYLIDQTNALISFNYHISALHYWAKNPTEIKNLEKWQDEFSRVKSSDKIPSALFARGMLNYYMVTADYYYDKHDFRERKNAFDEIMNWYDKAKLSKDEIYELAQYLCHQDQFSRAIKLLKNELKVNDTSENLLFYYLQILPYDDAQFTMMEYISKLHTAQSKFPERFCSFFSKEIQGIQPLQYDEVKEMYCSHCN